MKKILLHCKDENIELTDDDTSSLLEYSKELSRVMKSYKVIILETTSKSIIFRPSDIKSIEVCDTDIVME